MKESNNSDEVSEENYFKYSIKDLFAFLFIVILWATAHALGSAIPGLTGYALLFILMVVFATFTAFFINKFGAVGIVSLIAVTLIPSLPDLAGLGVKRYIIMGLVGLCFEIIHWLFTKAINMDPLRVILAASTAFATMPLWTGLMLSLYLTKLKIIQVLNLVFLDGLLAFLGASLAFLLWFYLRTYPFILKYKYEE
ncbi:hypothetical protein J4208_04565 [Candidatus Woesearchaeota archaeon]|nr:hypothetical protein [Candidatus Woesearchaeota archaeon]